MSHSSYPRGGRGDDGSNRGGYSGPPRGYGGPPQARGGLSRGRGRGGGPSTVVTTRMALPVIANTLRITSVPKVPFLQFEVNIDPEPKTPKKARLILHELQTRSRWSALFHEGGVFDGEKILYCRVDVTNNQGAAQFNVNLPPGSQGQRGGDFVVTLKRTAVISPLTERDFKGSTPVDPVSINILQMLVQEYARRNAMYSSPRRSLFFPKESPRSLPGGVDLIRGFFQSVKPVEGQVVVNIDTGSALMYTPLKLDSWAMDFVKLRGIRNPGLRDLERLERDNSSLWRELKQALRFVKVEYRSDKSRIRKIRGIVSRVGRVDFDRDGQRLTVQEHFNEMGHRLQHPDSFGVYTDEKKKNVVPAELCQIVPGQRYMRPLTKDQQSESLKLLTFTPRQKIAEIKKAQQFFQHTESAFLRFTGMAISPDPMQINGIRLPTPSIIYQGVSYTQTGQAPAKLTTDVVDGQWKIDNSFQFVKPVGVATWAIVNFASPTEVIKIRDFVARVRMCCESRGMAMPPPISEQDIITLGDFNEKSLREQALMRLNPKRPAAIIVFLPDARASDLHKLVKHWGDKSVGVTTQCLMLSKIQPKDLHNNLFGNNIALKLNAKLGGVNSIAHDARLKNLRSVPSMIIGADVAHPSPGQVDRPSIASIVVSYDENWARYYSYMDVQPPRQEYIENLENMMMLAFNDFGNQHKMLPSLLVYYRDGISEAQYDNLAAFERDAIRKAWDMTIANKGIKDPPSFQLTFIIVEKRHHIRFLPDVPDTAQDRTNVPAGLLVTRDVVSRNYENFYLVSQAGILGTSRPTHYVVKERAPMMTLEECQDLSYFLCHVNARTTRSAALPAPVNYADLLCREGFNYIASDHPILQSDNTTKASGEPEAFDIQRWREAFPCGKPVNERVFGKLFFL